MSSENQNSVDDVIEMNVTSQESQDVTDAPRRAANVASFYHTKKSTAEGMMDISLLTANANQLKFILYYNQASKTFYPALSLIILSLVLQVLIGFLLIFRVSFICRFAVSNNSRWCNFSVASSRTGKSAA